jgi:hypothetical protein
MTHVLHSLAVLTAALSLAGVSVAQQPPPAATTPGTGARVIDLTTPQPAECLAEPAGLDGPWMTVAPYGWVFGMRGTVGAGRRTAQVNLSVADSIDQLQDLKGAAQLHVESGYGPVGVIADLTYLRLEPARTLVTVDSRSTLLELLGMYRLVNTGGGAGAVTFDLLAGARYYRFRNEITGNLAGLLSAERENSWIDLVVGARAGVQVTDALGVFARADAGGFGIGDGSDRACNVLAGFEYRCCENGSLIGGYRWFRIDRESGVGRDRFLLDATLHGPFAALAIRY